MLYENWAKSKVAKMHDFWETHLAGHEPAYEIFKSPISDERSIVLIGFNPNFKERDIEADESGRVHHKTVHGYPDTFSLPEKTHLNDDSKSYGHKSLVQRCFFGGDSEMFSECVEMNRYFLRTDSKKAHRNILSELDDDAAQEYRNFCRQTNQEVLEKVDPDAVVLMASECTIEMLREWGYNVSITAKYEVVDFEDESRNADQVSSSVTIGSAESFIVISPEDHLRWTWLADTHYDFFGQCIPKYLSN